MAGVMHKVLCSLTRLQCANTFEACDEGAHRKVAAMTLDDLKTGLGILKPGQMLSISYAVYELVFPPGEPDELARTRAWAFAEEYGCTIKNLPSEKRVLFLKPKPPTKTKSK